MREHGVVIAVTAETVFFELEWTNADEFART
jgi:hypothetical protein